MTENTKQKGWILYDGDCSFCIATARRFQPMLEARNFILLPLQTPWVMERLGIRANDPLPEMKLLTASGNVFGGADAMVEIARSIWWAQPLVWLGSTRIGRQWLRASYRWIAERRHCIGGACKLPRRSPLAKFAVSGGMAWLPLLILPAIVFAMSRAIPAWAFMWLLAFAIFAGCKWLTLSLALRDERVSSLRKIVAYLLLWPGMDARTFLFENAIKRPRVAEWLFAILKTAFGALLIWKIAPLFWPQNPLTAGWLGMIGVIFLLHFGAFHLLALFWQRCGIKAEPIMRFPLGATSLGDFWGNRWNRGFNRLVVQTLFVPLRIRLGASGAMLLVFFVSGILHDLVITVPARGGYGLPTFYFLLQGIGVLAEHSRFGKKIGIRRGWRGWWLAMFFTLAPAGCLFPPVFVTRVMLPFLHALRAF